MNIGIDLRPLQAETKYRGIGTALQFLLEAMSTLQTTDQFVFYVEATTPLPDVTALFPNSRLIRIPATNMGKRRFLRSVLRPYKRIRPQKKDVDVFLQYDAGLGVPTTVPTVTVFHDLIPYLFRSKEKQLSTPGLRGMKNDLASNLYWQKYLAMLREYRKSSKIIAISKSSKKDLLAYEPAIKPDTIQVIHHGIGEAFLKPGSSSPEILKLTSQPFLLYVGGIDYRKNIVGLLEAFYALKPKHPTLRLVLVGKEFGLHSQLNDLGWFDVLHTNKAWAKDVIVPGYLSQDNLLYVYHQATCFVLPSRYEGFGLPILEAMQAGCPVVAYDNSSISEVAGDGAILLQDAAPLAPGIEKILVDKKLRSHLIAAGRLQTEKFNWNDTANQTLAVLKSTGEL